jgi:hypothetical protein
MQKGDTMKKSMLAAFAAVLLSSQSVFAHNPDSVYDWSAERYYNVPGKHVAGVNNRGLAHDELPAVLFISELASALPERIADLRKEGKSWGWIMDTFNIGPDQLYVPISSEVTKPPFDRLYGYFKSKQKSEWRSIKLTDAEVIDLVNLRFLARYFKVKPETIIGKRELGDGYVTICHYFASPKKTRRKVQAPAKPKQQVEQPPAPEIAAPPEPAVPDQPAADQAAPVPDTSGMAMPPAEAGGGMVPPDPEPAAEAPAAEGGSMMPQDPPDPVAADAPPAEAPPADAPPAEEAPQ